MSKTAKTSPPQWQSLPTTRACRTPCLIDTPVPAQPTSLTGSPCREGIAFAQPKVDGSAPPLLWTMHAWLVLARRSLTEHRRSGLACRSVSTTDIAVSKATHRQRSSRRLRRALYPTDVINSSSLHHPQHHCHVLALLAIPRQPQPITSHHWTHEREKTLRARKHHQKILDARRRNIQPPRPVTPLTAWMRSSARDGDARQAVRAS